MYTQAQATLVWKPYKRGQHSSIKLRITFKRENKIYATRSKEIFSKEEFENKRLKKTREALEIAEIDCAIANSICEELGLDFSFAKFKVIYDEKVNGKIVTTERVQVESLLDMYRAEKQCKANTIESYATAVNWVKKYNSLLTVQDITPEIVGSLVNYIKKQYRTTHFQEISPNTLGMYLRGLKALFQYAVENNIIQENPFMKVRIKQVERSKRALDIEVWCKVLEYTPTEKLTQFAHDFIRLSFAMCGANMADILSLTNRSIKGDIITFVRAKTERVDTNVGIPFTTELRTLLLKYGVINPKKPNAYILPFYAQEMTEQQKSYKRSDILKKINKGIRLICRELDIEPFTTYNIRHTFAAYSVEYNIPAEQLMMLLGHKNITTTQVYLKSITNNLMEKTTDFISEMLKSHQKKAL